MILNTFLYDYITYISENFQDIVSYIQRSVVAERANMKNTFRIPRYAEVYAMFSVVIDIFYKYALERSYLKENELEILSTQDKSDILSILKNNDNELFEYDPLFLALYSLKDGIESGSIRSLDLEFVKTKDDAMGDKIVYYDENLLYVRAETIFNNIGNYCRNQGIYCPYKGTKEIISNLKDTELLVIKNEGSERRSFHPLFGKYKIKRRYLYVYRDKLESFIADKNCN